MIERLIGTARVIEAGQEILRNDDAPESRYFIQRGWVMRSVTLGDGRRQVTGLLLPGDDFKVSPIICSAGPIRLTALGTVTVWCVHPERMAQALERRAIKRAFRTSDIVNEGILHSSLLSLGQRTSVERTAHLICELYLRSRRAGLVEGSSFIAPLTQDQIADMIGMTAVHVNRMLKEIRQSGLAEMSRHTVTVFDLPSLMSMASFEPAYLFVGGNS
ncbi:Crp/Fnr family transcriptional regulator [Sphingomonas faeni]|uniref:Crp/Fnr family transcriptional regulator n=1 Tax=Sphingomonas faeni TaxID=185950 RepID=UPI0033625067